jgi:hypothetical protein
VKFFGDGGASNDGLALQNTDSQTGPGQIKGTDQTIVAATDDESIITFHPGGAPRDRTDRS